MVGIHVVLVELGTGGVFSISLVQHPADDAGSPTILSVGYHVSCLGDLLAKMCWTADVTLGFLFLAVTQG